MTNAIDFNLIDLHIHVGGAVAPHILWKMAHEQGIKLGARTYWEFKRLVTASADKVHDLDSYLTILHQWTERIQSSPLGVEASIYEIISKEYRSSNVTAIELRFNPMKRNSEGALDLDHIIHAALRGMDRVCLEYGVEAGLIFCLAREFDYETNAIIVDKALRYIDRGVIGIDLAGTESQNIENNKQLLKQYAKLFKTARDAGLKTTVHTGETTATSGEGVIAVIEALKPHRIGHGIRAAYNKRAVEMLKSEDIVLEICPTCNLRTRAVKDFEEFKMIFSTFDKAGVLYTINTDGPYLLNTHMRQEFEMLIDNNVFDKQQVLKCLQTAKQASFIPALKYTPKPAIHGQLETSSEIDV